MSDYLPPEVVVDILMRVPVKSLLCCKCVCKSWNSIISSPEFITNHLKQTTARSRRNPFLFLKYISKPFTEKSCWIYRDNDEEFSVHSQMEHPCKIRSWNNGFIGSCDGVICLSNDEKHYLVHPLLWNPSIRRYLRLPRPLIPCHTSNNIYGVIAGFGFDSQNNDYKVVRIVNVRRSMVINKKLKHPIEVEIYSLNARSWKMIGACVDPFGMCFGNMQPTLLNGIVHWLVYRLVNQKEYNSVLTFDFKKELFDSINLPKIVVTEWNELSVTVCQKSLGVFHLDDHHCNIWVMQEYGVVDSWIKIFIIDRRGVIERPLCFRSNGEILMESVNDKLITYDAEEQKIYDLGIIGFGGWCRAESYVESLVLLNESKSDETPTKKRKSSIFVYFTPVVKFLQSYLMPAAVDEVNIRLLNIEQGIAGTSKGKRPDHYDKVVISTNEEVLPKTKREANVRQMEQPLATRGASSRTLINYSLPYLFRGAKCLDRLAVPIRRRF
ncbi:hypothetical protein K2173_006950 [Erythroxylum novogranatense]|uniref:F-box domain-containing protein n=1 Tax=Erythroxylum novogranatense TaxID=1862640 RepID=A0AAV8S6R3_9ROSI|nr:hypothetical protein K2173_006950 [Erythroxylum novogranatense]